MALQARNLWPLQSQEVQLKQEYFYDDPISGHPALKVLRIESPGQKKQFRQFHLDHGRWIPGKNEGEILPYKYGSWEKSNDEPIFLVEGEKCVEALIQRGLSATTTPGGSKNWRAVFSKYFKDRFVVIIPDCDNPGYEYAARAFNDISLVTNRTRVVELPDLADGEDIFDYFTKGYRAADLKALLVQNAAPSSRFVRALASIDVNIRTLDASAVDEKPYDLRPVNATSDPLPAEALIGIAGDLVKLVEPVTESDPAAILFQFLVAFGNLIGRSAYLQIGAARHYCNLFLTLVGDSSVGRKGTAWELVADVVRQVDETWWSDCRIFGLGSGEGLIAAVKDPEPMSLDECAKTNPNLPRINDKRGMVVEGEFALPLQVFRREGSTLSATLRNAWDNGDLRVTTKKESLKATGAHISAVCHVTRAELTKLFSDTDIFNGVGNRFIWITTRRSKLVPLAGLPDRDRIAEIVSQTRLASEFGKAQREMSIDADAQLLYRSIYSELTKDRPGVVGVLSGRSAPIVLRLSQIYALLDRSPLIERRHLLAGIAAWEYAERSLSYIFGRSTGDKDADKLRDALSDSPNGLSQTEIIEKVFARNKNAREIQSALNILLSADLVKSRQEINPTGRRVIRWSLKSTSDEVHEASVESSSSSCLVGQK